MSDVNLKSLLKNMFGLVSNIESVGKDVLSDCVCEGETERDRVKQFELIYARTLMILS